MPDAESFNVITTDDDLADMVDDYLQAPAFAFDVETVGLHRIDPVRNDVLWISFATEHRTDVIPMGHPNGEYLSTEYPLLKLGEDRKAKGLPLRPSDYSRDERKAIKHFGPPPSQLHRAEVMSAIHPLFFKNDALKIAQNEKFDVKSLAKYFDGQVMDGPFFDTMIASWLLDTRLMGQLNLAASLKREFGYTMEKGIGAMVENYTFDEVAKYSALDSHWTYRLGVKLQDRLEADGLDRLMRLEMDLQQALCAMELAGAPIDQVALKALHERLEHEIDVSRGQIWKLAGRVFNLNSNAEKQAILFTKKADGGRGLRPKKRTASGAPSVASDALEPFRGKDEFVDALLTYADLNKLMSTYVLPYLGGNITRTTAGKEKTTYRDSLLIDGRIHTDFVQNGAETGRLSSRNPNLQNVPNAKTENGKAIRKLFHAPEGMTLVCADYSQIEPRVIASFSQDPILKGAYLEGRDVYTAIADPLGLDRAAGKVAVLAMSYGVGPDKVESSLGLEPGTGRDLLDDFEKQFEKVYRYKSRVIKEARSKRPTPYVETILGRRRYLPDLKATEFGLKSRAERQAFNTKIQGSAADIMKCAIVRAHRMLPPEASLLLTVHDELLTVCPEDMGEEVAEVIREAMEGIHVLDIPLVAEVKIADNWAEAK